MERRDRASATTSESQLGLDLTHACCIWEHTGHNSRFQAWDFWTGHREHPSTFPPLCQSCARRVLGSEEDPSCPLLCDMWRSSNTFKPSEKLFFWVCSHFSRSGWPCWLNHRLVCDATWRFSLQIQTQVY